MAKKKKTPKYREQKETKELQKKMEQLQKQQVKEDFSNIRKFILGEKNGNK